MLLFPKAKVRNLSDRSSGSLQLSKSSHPREADSDSFYLTVLTEYTAAGTALDLLFSKAYQIPFIRYKYQLISCSISILIHWLKPKVRDLSIFCFHAGYRSILQ